MSSPCQQMSTLSKVGTEHASGHVRLHILFTLRIPHRTACGSGEDDGKRMVVVGSVSTFTAYGFVRRGSVVFGRIWGSCWVE